VTRLDLLWRRARARLFPTSMEAASISSRVIASGIETTSRPAFFLPGAFDAVEAVVNGDRALEWARVSGGAQQHWPTIEYVLERATIHANRIYSKGYVGQFLLKNPVVTDNARQTAVRFETAVLSTNYVSSREFGHWVRDSLVTELHAEAEGVPSVAIAREPWPHEAEFRALTGLDCAYPEHATIDRLVVLDDRGHNDHWRERFRTLRARTRASVATQPGQSAGPLVFLSRGAHASPRDPTNATEIEAALALAGFRSVVPSALSVREVGVALRDAALIVSVEGSNLNHLHFFAPEGVALVCLQDPRRFYAYHKGLMDLYDGRFGFIVGQPDRHAADRYGVDIEALMRTIDLAR
jgi:hypothetical protein